MCLLTEAGFAVTPSRGNPGLCVVAGLGPTQTLNIYRVGKDVGDFFPGTS
jgi:hypothetical protein